MSVVPNGVGVIALERKLVQLDCGYLPGDWYWLASRVLRGGDGGEHGKLLYSLVTRLSCGNRSIVALDVGTARGFSAIAMARAIMETRFGGMVYTLDVVDHERVVGWHSKKHDAADPLANLTMARSEIWQRWFREEQKVIVPITGRSSDVLREWSFGRVDIAFLDGSHTYNDVMTELCLLDSLLDEGGVILLDDYHLGVSVARVRSRAVNLIGWTIGHVVGIVWPKIRGISPSLGASNEYLLVKRRFHGIRKAVDEFMQQSFGRWSLEIVSMPSRGNYQGDDYSLALLTRSSRSLTPYDQAE